MSRYDDFSSFSAGTRQSAYRLVNLMYVAALCRPPEYSGAEFHATTLQNTSNAAAGDVFKGILSSPEAAAIVPFYGNMFNGTAWGLQQGVVWIIQNHLVLDGLNKSITEQQCQDWFLTPAGGNMNEVARLLLLWLADKANNGSYAENLVSLSLISSWDKNRTSTSKSDFNTITADYQTVLNKAATW